MCILRPPTTKHEDKIGGKRGNRVGRQKQQRGGCSKVAALTLLQDRILVRADVMASTLPSSTASAMISATDSSIIVA